jgi:DNA primase
MAAFPWLEQIITDATAHLPAEPEKVAYLKGRGVPLEEAIAHRLGALPAGYPVAACTKEFLDWQRWSLRGRLLFPITSPLGDVIGLQSRRLDEKRYQTFYAGSRQVYPPAFGMALAADAIYEREQAVVVEGIFDYFAVRAAGVPNTIALLTSHPTKVVLRFLDRYVRRACILTDMDEVGRESAERIVGRRREWEVVVPTYPAHDPADWLAAGGLPAMRRLLTPFSERYGVWNPST